MSTPDRPALREFWTDLPREGKYLLSVVGVQCIGTGLVLPFWVVYLHEVRGFALDTVGLLMSLLPLAGFLITVPGGILIDRFGPRRALMLCLSMACVGELVMAFATTVPVSALGLSLVGASFGLTWPASQSMVASVVPSEIRQRYFGMNFALLNLGIGIGGIIGGLFADVDRVSTFQTMYVVEAASYLPALVLMLGPLRHAGAPVIVHHEDATPSVSYLSLLRHRAVLPLVVLSFASAFVGYAQLNAGLPAYARAVSEVSTRALGWAFATNTLVIVLLQLVVLQRIEGHRRTRVVLVMSAVWGVCWLVLAGTSLVPGTVLAAFLLSAAAGVFALGETLLQPTIPAMVNDMAPDHLRGRYNAVTSAGFQLASVAGPPVAGFLVGHHLGSAWIGLLLVSLVGVAIIAVRWVEPSLTPKANGITEASAGLTIPPTDPVVPPAPQPPPA